MKSRASKYLFSYLNITFILPSTLRILELCNKYNYTPNKLAELSAITRSTLRALLANNVDNPSSTIIFKICKTLKIELKDFYDSPLFDMEKLEY